MSVGEVFIATIRSDLSPVYSTGVSPCGRSAVGPSLKIATCHARGACHCRAGQRCRASFLESRSGTSAITVYRGRSCGGNIAHNDRLSRTGWPGEHAGAAAVAWVSGLSPGHRVESGISRNTTPDASQWFNDLDTPIKRHPRAHLLSDRHRSRQSPPVALSQRCTDSQCTGRNRHRC